MAILLGCVCIILSPREASGQGNAIVPAQLRRLNTEHAEAVGAVSRQRVPFSGPAGDGRRGAAGILLKADPETSRTGSSWSFRYKRGGSAFGLQIIHPIGRGHGIVYLNKDNVGVANPSEWRKRGYSGGDTKAVRLSNAAEKIFPLKDGQEYEVISRVSPGGASEVFINEQLVAPARIFPPRQLSLEIGKGETFPGAGRVNDHAFKGEDLPLQWNASWGGLIVGPMDSGQNVCRDIRFYAGLVEVPGARP